MKLMIISGALALIFGVGISLMNHTVSKRLLKSDPNKLGMISIIRTITNVAYLALLYLLASVLEWPLYAMLICGAIGITIPPIILAGRLSAEISRKE